MIQPYIWKPIQNIITAMHVYILDTLSDMYKNTYIYIPAVNANTIIEAIREYAV